MATNKPQSDFVKTALRLPSDLHQRLHEAAAESGRSYNGEMLARLQSSFITETSAPDGLATREQTHHLYATMTRFFAMALKYIRPSLPQKVKEDPIYSAAYAMGLTFVGGDEKETRESLEAMSSKDREHFEKHLLELAKAPIFPK